MINYEVYVVGEDQPILVFASAWQFSESQRLFINKNGAPQSYNITRITHNLTGGSPVVRLNCHPKKIGG